MNGLDLKTNCMTNCFPTIKEFFNKSFYTQSYFFPSYFDTQYFFLIKSLEFWTIFICCYLCFQWNICAAIKPLVLVDNGNFIVINVYIRKTGKILNNLQLVNKIGNSTNSEKERNGW